MDPKSIPGAATSPAATQPTPSKPAVSSRGLLWSGDKFDMLVRFAEERGMQNSPHYQVVEAFKKAITH